MLAVNPRAAGAHRLLPRTAATYGDPFAAGAGFLDDAQREALVDGAVSLGERYGEGAPAAAASARGFCGDEQGLAAAHWSLAFFYCFIFACFH